MVSGVEAAQKFQLFFYFISIIASRENIRISGESKKAQYLKNCFALRPIFSGKLGNNPSIHCIRFQLKAFNETQNDEQNHDFSKCFQKSAEQKIF